MCYKCKEPLPKRKIMRSDLCASCGAELKVCLNCRFYKPGTHWDCIETIPEAVREKDRANFCDFFEAKKDGFNQETGKKSSAKSQFDSLFGD